MICDSLYALEPIIPNFSYGPNEGRALSLWIHFHSTARLAFRERLLDRETLRVRVGDAVRLRVRVGEAVRLRVLVRVGRGAA